jgi:uncharacterized protein YodC (DUF2158 family)
MTLLRANVKIHSITEPNWKVRDVVQLKSGGPPMTVVKVRDGVISCGWFDKSTRQMDAFPAEAVHKYEIPAPLWASAPRVPGRIG